MDDAAFFVMVLLLVEKKDTVAVVAVVAATAAWRDGRNTREEDPSNVVVALFVRDEPRRRNMTHPTPTHRNGIKRRILQQINEEHYETTTIRQGGDASTLRLDPWYLLYCTGKES